MEINKFIEYLKELNFSLAVEGGKLILKGDKKLTEAEKHSIKENDFVISYIKKHKNELKELVSFSQNQNTEKKSKDISSIYHLSGLQQGMLFHGLYDETGGAYIQQLSCDLTEPNLEIIQKSWDYLLRRHSILRSGFYYDEFSIPVQCVYRNVKLPVTIFDYTKLNDKEKSDAIRKYEEEDRAKGFDFKAAPLMRVSLFRLSEAEYRMIWTSHHILFDGWSMSVLMEEFLNTYERLFKGKEIDDSDEDNFEDYIKYIERKDIQQQEVYWRNYMKGVEQSTLLPFIGATSQRTKGIGKYETLYLEIDAETSERSASYAQRHHLTINTIIQGVWSYLLHRYTGNNDIVFGVIVSGRPDDFPEVENRVGLFINTLPLHGEIRKEKNAAQWLKEIQSKEILSRQYQYTPLQEILGWTGVSGDLFDSLLVFENYPVSEIVKSKQWSLGVKNIQMKEQTNYPLTILAGNPENEQIEIKFSYNKELWDKEYLEEIRGHFENILKQIVTNDNLKLEELELLSKPEEHRLLFEFNNTAADYPFDQTIIDLFEEQVIKTPENIAIVCDEKKLTYRDLNERVNKLAHYLISKGIKPEMPVPICIERSIEMIVGILGILKSGGAYVPVDPEYPAERINFMLEDTSCKIVVSSSKSKNKLSLSKGFDIIEIDSAWQSIISRHSDTNPKTFIKPNNLAYVIYTSGSTGKPKGVMIEHKNVYSFISWCKQEFSLSRFDIVYASTSICFDLSVFEMIYPLSIGKPLRILENGLFIGKYLPEDSLVMTNSVPGVIENLLKEDIDLSNLSVINMAGEPISMYVQQNLDTENIEVRNLYGPSEDTTYSTIFRLKKGEPVTIGVPVANTSIYILNSENKLSPVGVSGEICISGDGITRGYLNRTELTAEKFISNPFSKEPGSRMYKTGDLGRRLPDGSIEYLGRKDEQVKIRGYRIELGEIESVIQESSLVQQSVVVVKSDEQGNKRLVCYVVAKDLFDKEKLMTYLQRQLPEYMIPYIWVEMESMPLTQNGKIDRKALPVPDAGYMSSNEYAAPRNETEEKLAEIWKELLHIDRVGINDNFFELGGDSIITIQVMSRSRRQGIELKPKDIFIHQTISSLSAAIEERSAANIKGEQGMLKGRSGLLPIQQWYLEKADEAVSHFNQSILLSIDKSVTPEILSEAAGKLMAHHDALRFRYYKEDGNWIQEYGVKTGELITVDLKPAKKNLLKDLIKASADKFQKSLNIEKGEIAKFVLMQTPENENHNRLFIVIQHLAVDGVSWRILLDDLEILIHGIQKNEKTDPGYKSSSYRQWYESLEKYGQRSHTLLQSRYWEEAMQSNLSLKTDKEYNGIIRSKDLRNQSARLSSEKTRQLLQDVQGAYHTEINDILLCALAITICDWSSSKKAAIGLEGHGRENITEGIDLSRTVGWFTNLYPVLLEPAPGGNLSDKIKSVKEQLRKIPDKGMGFGVLKYINKNKNLSGKDSWEIIFNYLGQLDNAVSNSKILSLADEERGTGRSEEQTVNEKLSVSGFIQSGELTINWDYSTFHFEEATIAKLAEKFLSNLESLISHCIEQQKREVSYTPSDYGLGAEISYNELDKFLEEPYKGKRRKDQVESLYRLSGLQQGMLFHSIYDSESGAYTEQLSCELINPDTEKIIKCWNHLLSSHSILRSGFYYDEFSIPVQCVYRDVKISLTNLDFSDMGSGEQEEALKEYKEADRLKGFDFKTAPLMRIALIRLCKERYCLLWTSHHILIDGWSMSILMEEFLSAYEKLTEGKELVRTKEDSYEDYIRYIENSDKEKQEQYWSSYMKEVEQSTLLPFIGTTVKRTKGEGVYKSVYLNFDSDSTAKAGLYAQRHRITISTIMQGVWSYLLHRYTGNKEIVFGIIVSGRPDNLSEIERRAGLYINTLPHHSSLQNEQMISQWLVNFHDSQVSSSQYQYTPLQEIQKLTKVSGDLFDSLLVFENYPVSEILKSKKWSLNVENVKMSEQTNFPLTIAVSSSDELQINFSYNAELLAQEHVQEISGHFENILKQIITNGDIAINELELLTRWEKYQLLSEFNDTSSEYPSDKTIIDLFEEQVKKTPYNIAVISGEEQLTYKELNERANQLAYYLQIKGVKSGMPVPICMERSIEIIVGILGILKSGGAYVPIDPDYPQERIEYMIEDTGASIVLSSKGISKKLSSAESIIILNTEEENTNISKQSTENLTSFVKPGDLAYVIYTSGSTGRPKGVMIEHTGVVNLISWHNKVYEVSGKSRATTMAGIGFDAFGWEVWPYLSAGASVTIVDDDTRLNSPSLINLFNSNEITHCFIPTALVQEFVNTSRQKLNSLKYLLAGGDKLSGLLIEGEPYKLVNNYGPTENTVVTSYYELPEKDSHLVPPIGKPISNTKIYILNEENKLSPVSVPGEICISGNGIARGYFNRPELTAEKFISNPFNKGQHLRIYKTGDLGRWLPDGNIEYLGRKDEQVKIRGYRIELGEIESILQEYELISQSAVLAKEDEQGNKRIVAYVVAKDLFDREKVMLYLKSRLPDYMVPSLWVEMESLPLNKSGKIDRKALPDPDASELLENEYVAPRNETEEKLAAVWKELLHVERVGVYDNFFELGGDSIITIQVVSRARRVGFELKPKDIFTHQTISSLSKAIAERSAAAVTGEQELLTGRSGLLPIQQWYLNKTVETVSHFNQAVLLSIDKSVTPEVLRKAVKQLTSHHDALRFKYYKEDGKWIQEYGAKTGKLITVDLKSAKKNMLNGLIKEKADEFQRSLDIEKGEIARFVLIQTPEKESHNRIFIVIHHLAFDGVSWRILLDDLELLISGLQKNEKPELGYKSSSYRQWHEALENYGKSPGLLSQSRYWQLVAGSFEPLSTDKEYEAGVRSREIKNHRFNLDPDKTKLLLHDVSRAYHTDINDILLCALAMSLCDWKSSDEKEVKNITIGLEGHGRENITEGLDTSRTVGWFTNLYPVLLEISPGREISDKIKSVKEQLRRIPDKGIGYGVLKYINEDEGLRGKDCWDIVFNYLGQFDNIVNRGRWLSKAEESGGSGRREESLISEKLSVNGFIQGNELIFNLSYSEFHFDEATITDLSQRFQSNLESIINHCIESQKTGVVKTPSDFGLGQEISYEELDKFLYEPYKGKQRKDSIEGLYRLSGLQEGMMFHSLYDGKAGAYTEQLSCDLRNPDLKIISKSWDFVLRHHSILRSGFYYDVFSVPVQCVNKEVEIPLTILDYRNLSKEEQALSIKEFAEADRMKGFDFKSAPLIRIALLRTDEDSYKMFWTWHHILFDGWSMPILLEEFLTTYESLKSGRQPVKKEEDRYEDYIRYIERENREQQENYWRNYMDGVEQSTLLPFIGTTTQRTKGAGVFETLFLKLDPETSSRIESYTQKHRLTINTLMQGVWSYILHRYTGNINIVYGVIVSGRPDDLPGIEQRVGMFINTLPLHSVMQKEQEISKWLQDLQFNRVSSRQYQYTSLQEIQGWTGVQGDLFDNLLVFENYPLSEIIGSKQWSLQVENVQMEEQTNYPLTIIINNSEQINIGFSYNSSLWEKEYVEEIRSHFENVLIQIISDEVNSINEIKLLTEHEEHLLLNEFNDTAKEYPEDKAIIDLFEEQAEKTPDKIAIEFEDQKITYIELNERSNQLAHYLQSIGVKENSIIPICTERSPEMIIGLLGVMKSGASYLPIDPEYPHELKKYMLEDSVPSVIIADKGFDSWYQSGEGPEIIYIDKDAELLNSPLSNVSRNFRTDHILCVMYTSGSSGKPKGVKVTDAGMVNRFYWMWENYPFEKNEKCVMKTSLSFGDHIWEIFGPLNRGVCSVLLKKSEILDLDIFAEKLNLKGITRLVLVPSLLRILLDKFRLEKIYPEYLKYWTCSGEALPFDLIKDFYELFDVNEHKLLNIYGSTEVSADVTFYDTSIDFKKELRSNGILSEDDNKSNALIGKPIANCRVYIVDTDLNVLPAGISGEICIGGIPVGDGYLNRPELTSEKFIDDPFSKEPGAKIYRTGDIGRWTFDGNIEYMGRKDYQVKIRGFRVELGEIENELQQSHLVRDAVVLAREDKEGLKRLVGYVVPEGKFDKKEIATYLKSKLPDYMVPSLWVELEAMPLTPSGKTNKNALPETDVTEGLSNEYIAPKNETEIKLASIWAELLHLERVGTEDNFFELGGQSLLAMRMISSVRRELKSEIGIKDLFINPTISALAIKIESQSPGLLLPEIEAQPRPERIPLSFSQERLWFIDALEGSVQYHIPSVLRLKGKLDQEALKYAFKTIITRHEVLRTVILQDEGEAYQKIKSSDDWNLEIADGSAYKEDGEALKKYVVNLVNNPFDLSKDYMLRVVLIRLSEHEHLLISTMHHIASDGWSVSIIVKEMAELYSSFIENRDSDLANLPVQYADYAIWQRKYSNENLHSKKLNYWKEKLERTSPLELPTDYPRQSVQTVNGAITEFIIDKDISDQLLMLSKQNGATPFMVLLTAFNILLYRYSGQDDICVGTPVANRTHNEVENLIGFFVNVLALRSNVNAHMTFAGLLEQVKLNTLEAYENQDVPFEKVVEAVVKERDLSRSPLFQVMFILQNTPEIPELKFGEVELIPEESERITSRFELTFSLAETANGIKGAVEYNTDLYEEETVGRMIVHFKKLLSSIVKDPNDSISSLPMISEEEEQQLLYEFNNTAVHYPEHASIPDLFEQQVQKTPDSIAAVFDDQHLTYKELNNRSNQLAHYLQFRGVKEETLVPICLERSLNMITGIMGILKAGGAYVPIDPDYPEERIKFMLEDTGASIILSTKDISLKLPVAKETKVIDLDSDDIFSGSQTELNLKRSIQPNNLAYVIYTSGSTGKPKGVMTEHGALLNRLNWAQNYFKLTDEDSVLQKTTMCFDVSVWELLWPLLAGAKLIFAEPGGQKDTEYLKSVIDQEKITMLHFVPSMLELFLADVQKGDCPGLKKVLCSGEALKYSQAELFFKKFPGTELHNLYGPTEAAIDVTYWSLSNHLMEEHGLIPIGRPVSNTNIYILDENNGLVSIGGIGEIHIGGKQAARGYLNRPDLTEEKFVKDPFSKKPNARMYKTGDLGCWLSDGTIEYIGRKDDQVKINGNRIELGEIENILQDNDTISQSVVLARETKEGGRRLVGYVVTESDFDRDALISYLQRKLPEYMIPYLWVEMESLPLTPNGKINRKALPDPDISGLTKNEYAAPRNELEENLAGIWKELLHVESIGINDNFFELGGDSIITIQVVSRARRIGYELKPKDIFIYQTIGSLSAVLTERTGSVVIGEQGKLKGLCGLVPIQQWYLEGEDKSVSHFNQSLLLSIDKSVTPELLGRAVEKLTEHHDSLRFRYYKEEGQWIQQYGDAEGELITVDLRNIKDGLLNNLIKEHADKYQRSLNIEKGEVSRFVLIQTPEEETQNRMLIVIHHLAVDGVSWRILLDDLQMLLTGYKDGGNTDLGIKSSSYRQWYEALENYGKNESLLNQNRYWERIAGSYKPLPADKNYKGILKSGDIRNHIMHLDAENTQLLLQEAHRAYHTEINDILLCALAMSFCDRSSEGKIIIGLEGHGREDIFEGIDTSRTTGWFTSLYPVLLEPGNIREISNVIKAVKEQMRQIPDKGIGYGILKYINRDENLSGKECWDIVFNYLGQLDNAVTAGKWFSSAKENDGSAVSEEHKVNDLLTINGSIQRGQLILNWNYSSLHFEEGTIKNLASQYLINLKSIIVHCSEQLKNGAMHTPSDYGLGTEISIDELDIFLNEQL